MRRGALLLVLLLAACGGDPEAVRVVRAVEVSPGQLAVDVASCGGTPAFVELEQSRDEVRLRVEADPSGAGACTDGLVVPLSAPLGGRPVVDDESGERVG